VIHAFGDSTFGDHALGCFIEQFDLPPDRFAIPVRPDLL
jgi:hypothetical protein